MEDSRSIEKLTEEIIEFRDARDWAQFHNPKDLALSLVLEATEFMEHFQWKKDEDISSYLATNKDELAAELADVLYWVLLISHDLEIDPIEALAEKLRINEAKYPIDKARGTATKYDRL